MSKDSDSNARCLKATELTLRFMWNNLVPLGVILCAVCIPFRNGLEPGINVGVAIMVLYFTVAYNFYGRGNRTSAVIAALSGVAAGGASAAMNSASNSGSSSIEFNPATGLMMFGHVDAMGNPYGIDLAPGGAYCDDTSISDDDHFSFNPANGLPMFDNLTDMHGNIFGTNSMVVVHTPTGIGGMTGTVSPSRAAAITLAM